MTSTEFATRIRSLTDAELARVMIAAGILESESATAEDKAWILANANADAPAES